MKILIQVLSEDEHAKALKETGFWGRRGAGCLVWCSTTDRFLMPKRSKNVQNPGTWGTWGGAIDENEDTRKAALREAREELGIEVKDLDVYEIYTYTNKQFTYTTYLIIVTTEFKPNLNWETSKARWLKLEELKKLHLYQGVRLMFNDVNAMHRINQIIRRYKNA